jgi:hypothetical protein
MKSPLILLGMLMLVAGLASIVYGLVQEEENSDASESQMMNHMRSNLNAIRSGGRPTFPDFDEEERQPHRAPFAWIFGGIMGMGLGGVLSVTALGFGNARRLSRQLQNKDLTTEIERLAKLRADGYITGEDYEAAKAKLLEDA